MSKSHHDVADLYSLTNVPIMYKLPTTYGFQDIAHTRFQRSRSLWQGLKTKSRSHYYVVHLYPLTSVCIKYQLATAYGLCDISWTRFWRSRSQRQGQRSNQGHTMTIHIYSHQQMSIPNINLLHLTDSEKNSTQGQIKVTLWCCTPTSLNQCPDQVSTSYTLWLPRYTPDKISKV